MWNVARLTVSDNVRSSSTAADRRGQLDGVLGFDDGINRQNQLG